MQEMMPESCEIKYFRNVIESLVQVLEREPNSIKLHVVLETLASAAKILSDRDVERIVVADLTNRSMRKTYDVPQNLEKIYSEANYPEVQSYWLLLCQAMPDWQNNSKKTTGGDDWKALKSIIRMNRQQDA